MQSVITLLQNAIAVKGYFWPFSGADPLIGILAALAIVYAGDWAAFQFHIPGGRTLYADIRVDQVYTDTNKYNKTECSRGNLVNGALRLRAVCARRHAAPPRLDKEVDLIQKANSFRRRSKA